MLYNTIIHIISYYDVSLVDIKSIQILYIHIIFGMHSSLLDRWFDPLIAVGASQRWDHLRSGKYPRLRSCWTARFCHNLGRPCLRWEFRAGDRRIEEQSLPTLLQWMGGLDKVQSGQSCKEVLDMPHISIRIGLEHTIVPTWIFIAHVLASSAGL